MRSGAFLLAMLVGRLAISFSAQAATLTMTADKSTYAIGETINIEWKWGRNRPRRGLCSNQLRKSTNDFGEADVHETQPGHR